MTRRSEGGHARSRAATPRASLDAGRDVLAGRRPPPSAGGARRRRRRRAAPRRPRRARSAPRARARRGAGAAVRSRESRACTLMPCLTGRVRIPSRVWRFARVPSCRSVHESSAEPGADRGVPRRPGTPAVPPARALLAVRRSAGAADRRGARRARSRPARGALRRAAAAVLDHARVPALRRARTTRARSSWRARRPSTARSGTGDALRHRARFYPTRRRRARATCSRSSAASTRRDVLIDDRPVPYARELWLPLVWFLIRWCASA